MPKYWVMAQVFYPVDIDFLVISMALIMLLFYSMKPFTMTE